MRYVTAFQKKFLLNLSTEEGCYISYHILKVGRYFLQGTLNPQLHFIFEIFRYTKYIQLNRDALKLINLYQKQVPTLVFRQILACLQCRHRWTRRRIAIFEVRGHHKGLNLNEHRCASIRLPSKSEFRLQCWSEWQVVFDEYCCTVHIVPGCFLNLLKNIFRTSELLNSTFL